MKSNLTRRKFIAKTTLASAAVLSGKLLNAQGLEHSANNKQALKTFKPLVISTWNNHKANAVAWKIIEAGGKAIDAVEQGVRVPEGDVKDQSVGYGGRPDRSGKVTLDACIMNEKGDCGSVCYLQHIKHPISVARLVMEKTPHVMLAGKGALRFALANGFKKENLLSVQSKKEWKKWLKKANYKPIINIENHDTIGMLAIDKNGDISGACTTSGLAFKMEGRVGDSPIIGAGLFVDNEIGAATATGLGEAVLKTLGSFLVVELMRQGRSPQEACKEAVMRIVKKQGYKDFQVGYIAINKQGETGAYCIQKGFNYVLNTAEGGSLKDGASYL